jgi:hypothetical protein
MCVQSHAFIKWILKKNIFFRRTMTAILMDLNKVMGFSLNRPAPFGWADYSWHR